MPTRHTTAAKTSILLAVALGVLTAGCASHTPTGQG
jgi:hypothetical protein